MESLGSGPWRNLTGMSEISGQGTDACSACGLLPGRPCPHLVEKSLAEVLHGPLELTPLRLPLLIAAHILSGGSLPRGGPCVVIHIVKPASGICAFFPAGNTKLRISTATTPAPAPILEKFQDS